MDATYYRDRPQSTTRSIINSAHWLRIYFLATLYNGSGSRLRDVLRFTVQYTHVHTFGSNLYVPKQNSQSTAINIRLQLELSNKINVNALCQPGRYSTFIQNLRPSAAEILIKEISCQNSLDKANASMNPIL